MARREDEGGSSRLWRGMRHLIFGEDSEPTLRGQIEEAIEEAEDSRPVAGDLSPPERQMLRNLLHFGDQTAGEIAVTRGDIIAVPSDISFDQLVQAFADAGHSRLPVYGESLDEVIGMVHIKDVFIANVDGSRDRSLRALMREPLFVPESMSVIELLARMRSERVHLAIIVDEFGGTEGLVTIEDVVEEIVGDIDVEHEHRRLLARLAREAHRRWNDELHVRVSQPVGEPFPGLLVEHDPEVRDRHFLAVDRIARPRARRAGRQMGDDLMAAEVEIDP